MGLQKPIASEKLIISRPELQSGLTDVIPLGEKPSHYLNRYRSEYKVRCAFCENHTPHNNGFTVQMKDGRTALCGKVCAGHYFGTEVADNFEEELNRQIKRESKRKIIEKTLNGIPRTLTLLSDELLLLETQTIVATHALVREFQHSGLQAKLTESGAYEHITVQRRWMEKEDNYGKMRKVPVDEERLELKVKAASVLLGGDLCRVARLERAKTNLQKLAALDIQAELSDTIIDRMSETRIDRMSETRNSIISDIQIAVRFFDLCFQFYTKENIKALSKTAKYFNTAAEAIALHKRPYGFDLIITPQGYADDPNVVNYGPERTNLPVPDLTDRPSEEILLAALKGNPA